MIVPAPGDGRRVYLIRHGKADRRSMREAETPRGIAADPPLDATGREQAAILAKRLRRMPAPSVILCSTLTRARETIAPFVELTGTDVEYRDDLVEWFGGEWEFKEFEELLVEHPEIPQRILFQDPLFHLAPGGEPFPAFQRRCVDAIEGALARHDDGDLWVVCHGGVINAYVGWVLGIEHQEMFFLPPNTSINTVRVLGDRRALWFLADDTHVTEPGLFPDEAAVVSDEGPPGAVLDSDASDAEQRGGSAVAVRFLSPEWAEQLTTALNARDSFKAAAVGKHARLQQVITGEADTRYWIVIDDGTIQMGLGDLDPPVDATITQSYETAVGLAQRTVNPVTGFMLGKIKVDGNMGMLMGLTGVLQELPEAMATIDTEY